jgi:predicted lipid carrier protein YhbT
MASVDECRQALHDLAARLDANAETRGKLDFDRTLACRVPDLGAAFHARLVDGRLVDIADGDDPKAKIALTADSDDLIALVQGRLDVTRAIAARQVAIKANPFDLLKLRKLL